MMNFWSWLYSQFVKPDSRPNDATRLLGNGEKSVPVIVKGNISACVPDSLEVSVPMPTIIVDGVFFQMYRTGIARVWASLLAEWVRSGFNEKVLVLDRAESAPRIEGVKYICVPRYDYNNTAADRAMLEEICGQQRASLFISSYYTTPLTTRSVFMGYDMIPEVDDWDLSQPMWVEKRRAIEHASAYITISQNTAQDLARFYPYAAERGITVAHCGVSGVFTPATVSEVADFRNAAGISKPYFMLSGARGGYKNVGLFFHGLERLAERERFEVVCTGTVPQLEAEFGALLGPVHAHVLDLPDTVLRLAYSGALALAYPSMYEGFGMPVAEAMACGCPVITTRRSSLPEVAGEAAIYVEPDDIGGMADALRQVQKPELRAQLIQAGLSRAQGFSWSRMAQTVSAALERTVARAAANRHRPE